MSDFNDFIHSIFPYTDFNKINLDWIMMELTRHREALEHNSDSLNGVVSWINGVNYVSPEQYGAIGDGDTDDTAAWKKAISSGKPIICKRTAIYKISETLNIHSDITIDGNNCRFICTADTLFHLVGSVIKTYNANDYIANTNYILSNYNGYAVIKGGNNSIPFNDNLKNGGIVSFSNGVLNDSFPVSITEIKIDELKTISAIISNIADVIIGVDGTVIFAEYNANSKFININCSGALYSLVRCKLCYNCVIEYCTNVQPMYTGQGVNTYIVLLESSSKCIVNNCIFANLFWDCFSTGGTYFCVDNQIKDSVMIGQRTHSIDDHHNGIGTIVTNTVLTTATLGGRCYIHDCKIISPNSSNYSCNITLLAMPIEFSQYRIENVDFYPSPTASNVNIILRRISDVQGVVGYFDFVKIKNVTNHTKLSSNAEEIVFNNSENVANTIKVNSLDIDNVNLVITLNQSTIDTSSLIAVIKNVTRLRGNTNNRRVQVNAPNGGELHIYDSFLYYLSGGVPSVLKLFNVKIQATQELRASSRLLGVGIEFAANFSIVSPPIINLSNIFTSNQSRIYASIWRNGAGYSIMARQLKTTGSEDIVFYQI